MKKLILICLLLALPALGAAEAPPRNCYEDYRQIMCGEQDILTPEEYCPNITLTVKECYSRGRNLTVIFSGIDSFELSNKSSDLVFKFYSRDWAWTGDENPLPVNSTIRTNSTDYIVKTPLGNKKIESVQITVPFCYKEVDSEGKKLYPRTQAGKTCGIREAEKQETEDFKAPKVNATLPVENNQEKETEDSKKIREEWVLIILAVVVLIAGFFTLREKKKK